LNSITAQQQMCRQMVAGGQTKDYLRDIDQLHQFGIAHKGA
jgi:hypothetical protein